MHDIIIGQCLIAARDPHPVLMTDRLPFRCLGSHPCSPPWHFRSPSTRSLPSRGVKKSPKETKPVELYKILLVVVLFYFLTSSKSTRFSRYA